MKTVTAVVAKYGVVDSQGDVLMPGCFDTFMPCGPAKRKPSTKMVKKRPHYHIRFRNGCAIFYKLRRYTGQWHFAGVSVAQ